MKHIQGLSSSSQALRQVFVTCARNPRVGILPFRPIQYGAQLRSFQQSHRLDIKESRQPVVQNPRNEAIGAPYICVVNDQGLLDSPITLLEALDTFDHSESFLMQVQEATNDQLPVCKIINKKAWQKAQKALEKSARASKTGSKQIELNWAIDAHDLSHRLKQMSKFLDKGYKVEILLTTKKRKRNPTVDEIKKVMQNVLDTIKAAGARQTQEIEGEVGKQLKIFAKKVKQNENEKKTEEEPKSENAV